MYRDAAAAEMDGTAEEAESFRVETRELEERIQKRLDDIPSESEGGCVTCAGKREVIGNGTYGGPAKKQRLVMQIV